MKSLQFTVTAGRYARFWCPACDDLHQVDAQWEMSPEGQPLTLSPSVLVLSGPIPRTETSERRCHSFVKDDRIQFLNDSTHHMAGQTAELPELPEWLVKDTELQAEALNERCNPETGTHADPHRGCILR